MSKAAIFHTSAATLALFQTLTAKIMPDVEIMHIVEDAMIRTLTPCVWQVATRPSSARR